MQMLWRFPRGTGPPSGSHALRRRWRGLLWTNRDRNSHEVAVERLLATRIVENGVVDASAAAAVLGHKWHEPESQDARFGSGTEADDGARTRDLRLGKPFRRWQRAPTRRHARPPAPQGQGVGVV